MSIHDFKCSKCDFIQPDVLVRSLDDEDIKCPNCGTKLEKMMGSFSFKFTPSSISKHKHRYGNKLPDNYKTTGGANIYGRPKKPR